MSYVEYFYMIEEKYFDLIRTNEVDFYEYSDELKEYNITRKQGSTLDHVLIILSDQLKQKCLKTIYWQSPKLLEDNDSVHYTTSSQVTLFHPRRWNNDSKTSHYPA